jgi:riboflavin biosynthesis pyrimidine reductase
LAEVVAAGRLDELCATVSPRLVAGDGPRILTGRETAAPVRLQLAHLLEEDDNLFARYLVTRA